MVGKCRPLIAYPRPACSSPDSIDNPKAGSDMITNATVAATISEVGGFTAGTSAF